MIKKEMIAMLLAGGQGSRLGVLTKNVAKPAVSFGGKYSIIDFPLSNCINSGIDTVGVLTQYQPLRLNAHIGIGIPWDLDRNRGGVTVLQPYESLRDTGFYSGTANAIYQNIAYIENYDPEYVLILSGDHVYKMDYEVMLEYHKAMKAYLTIASMPVPMEEASRFGITVTDEHGRIMDFQEKPKNPKSNLASMGIYIFNWKVLKEALIRNKDVPDCDFGKHVIPYLFQNQGKIYAYEFNGYWKDVGTLLSYWESNMELIALIPEFNLYEEYWKIYTQTDNAGPGVTVEHGAVIVNSIIMENTVIGENTHIDQAVVAENVTIGNACTIGTGEYQESGYDSRVYCSNLVTIGENSRIPDGVRVGRNTAIFGTTVLSDYPDGLLSSGGAIIREEERA